MQEKTYKAIIYIRLSVADSKPGESDSVANQRRLIYEWLKDHPEIEVVGEMECYDKSTVQNHKEMV